MMLKKKCLLMVQSLVKYRTQFREFLIKFAIFSIKLQDNFENEDKEYIIQI